MASSITNGQVHTTFFLFENLFILVLIHDFNLCIAQRDVSNISQSSMLLDIYIITINLGQQWVDNNETTFTNQENMVGQKTLGIHNFEYKKYKQTHTHMHNAQKVSCSMVYCEN